MGITLFLKFRKNLARKSKTCARNNEKEEGWCTSGDCPGWNCMLVILLPKAHYIISVNVSDIVMLNSYYKQEVLSCQVLLLTFSLGLFNLRGSDVTFNPVFFAYAIITQDEVRWVCQSGNETLLIGRMFKLSKFLLVFVWGYLVCISQMSNGEMYNQS